MVAFILSILGGGKNLQCGSYLTTERKKWYSHNVAIASLCVCATLWEYLNNSTQWCPLFRQYCGGKSQHCGSTLQWRERKGIPTM